MSERQISDAEFGLFQRLIYRIAGIRLGPEKKVLLVGRLAKRLRHHGLSSFREYYALLAQGDFPSERQIMVDLLTTNETYFFREPQHFAFLKQELLSSCPAHVRIWSAASSSGEEAYSIAMTLASVVSDNNRWEVFGSDISSRVLERAEKGIYTLERTDGIPPELRRRYCMKGVRSQAGTLMISPEIRQHVRFSQINLMHEIDPSIGQFDVVFLRNVMIYFDLETKIKVVRHLLPRIKAGGYLLIGHSESLSGMSQGLTTVRPTIYRKGGDGE